MIILPYLELRKIKQALLYAWAKFGIEYQYDFSPNEKKAEVKPCLAFR